MGTLAGGLPEPFGRMLDLRLIVLNHLIINEMRTLRNVDCK